MSCFHPYKAFIVGTNPDTGKNILKIKPYEVEYLYTIGDFDKYFESRDSLCPNKPSCTEKVCDYSCLGKHLFGVLEKAPTLPEVSEPISKVFKDFITIPCGKCDGCKVDHSKEWANRLVLEDQYSFESWFLTLTYDEENVPRTYYYSEDENGEEVPHEVKTLYYRDFQLFMKKLRKNYGSGIRFYCAGEYGDITHRPHYHAIFFNIHLDDLREYGRSDSFMIYESPKIDELWGQGKVVIAPVTWATCAYVARYVTKKFLGNEKWKYEKFHIQPEFSKMSRKPGIGRQWYDEHKDSLFETYIIVFGDECNQYEFNVPKYFSGLMEIENPDKVRYHKDNKIKAAKNAIRTRLTQTDLSYLEQLEVDEESFRLFSKYQGLRDRSKV